MRLLHTWRLWRDRRRRARIERGAFADGRFVMYFWIYGADVPACFAPRENEAEEFFRLYLIPWIRGEMGVFHDSGPWQSPGGSKPWRRTPFLRFLRGNQIVSIEILAGNSAYRDRLADLSRRVSLQIEETAAALRTAEQAAQYSRTVAAMRDAHREIERGGQGGGG